MTDKQTGMTWNIGQVLTFVLTCELMWVMVMGGGNMCNVGNESVLINQNISAKGLVCDNHGLLTAYCQVITLFLFRSEVKWWKYKGINSLKCAVIGQYWFKNAKCSKKKHADVRTHAIIFQRCKEKNVVDKKDHLKLRVPIWKILK